jgi:hypothetical protein
MESFEVTWKFLLVVEGLIVLATAFGTVLGLFFVEYLKNRRRDYVYEKYFLKPKPNTRKNGGT